MLPAVVSGVAAIAGMVGKAHLIKVEPDELLGVQLSSGNAPIIVLVAAVIALFFGLSLAGLGDAEAREQ